MCVHMRGALVDALLAWEALEMANTPVVGLRLSPVGDGVGGEATIIYLIT